MSSSDTSSLSPPPSDDDEDVTLPPLSIPKIDIPPSSHSSEDDALSNEDGQAEQTARPPSPAHEHVLADNPDIAFIVMFRSRFAAAFTKIIPHFGPQDIENGITDEYPSPHVETFLCALLGLVLNRKKYVERNHYGRALEEAVASQKQQWPQTWNGISPLAGGKTFVTMTSTERLNLLRVLILWSLNASDIVSTIVKENYKSRQENDLRQELAVHFWGVDGEKRRYWLIEGQDDTSFRLYRESNPHLKTVTWWNVAGEVNELKSLVETLSKERSQSSRRLGDKIDRAIPRFEGSEEKRKKREYRLARKAQFSRPGPGFSIYEGRTRGKRIKYTFSDEDDDDDDDPSDAASSKPVTRRAAMNGVADPNRPTITASGRQVRTRNGGTFGAQPNVSGQNSRRSSPGTADHMQSETSDGPRSVQAKPTRSSGHASTNGWAKGEHHIESYNSVDEMGDEEEASTSGGEGDGGDEYQEVNGKEESEEDDDNGAALSEILLDQEDIADDDKGSLIVQLRYQKTTDAVNPEHEELNNTDANLVIAKVDKAVSMDNSTGPSDKIPLGGAASAIAEVQVFRSGDKPSFISDYYKPVTQPPARSTAN